MSIDPTSPATHGEVRVSLASGSVTVIAENRTDVVAEGDATVERVDDHAEIVTKRASKPVTIRCPVGTDVVVGTRSGALHLQGRLGAVRATTMSGRIEVDTVRSVDARATSGSITVGVCDETCRARTKSGSVRVGTAGSVEVTVGSGRIRIEHVRAAAHVRAISGTVEIDADGDGAIEVETMSGSVTVTLPADRRPSLRGKSLSGRRRVEMPEGDDVEVRVKTLSGSVTVRPRAIV